MKKTFLFPMIFVTTLFVNSLNAQSYLDSTSTWYEYFGGADFVHISIGHNTYFIDGDTSISGNNYYKLYWNQVDSVWDIMTDSLTAVNYSYHVYQGGLREDAFKRFYIFYPTQASELLLFDFNLSMGDSTPDMIANYGCNIPRAIVTAIDTFYLGTGALKKFVFSPGIPKTLYEGIGASGGFIWSGSLCQAFESGGCLIAYKKGLDSLYINCGLGAIGISELSSAYKIKVFPNPATDHFTIEGDFSSNEIFQLRNSFGEEVLINYVREKSTVVKTSELESGIYFWEIGNTERRIQCGKIIVIN